MIFISVRPNKTILTTLKTCNFSKYLLNIFYLFETGKTFNKKDIFIHIKDKFLFNE